MDIVRRLYEILHVIVSNQDIIFTNLFWNELIKVMGTNLLSNFAYHSQMNRQIEKLNQCLKMYLWCMANQQLKTWVKWLAAAEWWYNTSYHMSLKMTPFQALYRYPPPHFSYSIELYPASPSFLSKREEVNKKICQHLLKAQYKWNSI